MSSSSDPRFDEILAAYLDADASGRAKLLAAHPEHAEKLGRFADNERWLRDAVAADAVTAETPDAGGRGEPSRVRYVGDYEILGEIARGAMGVVYRARQISLGRKVALKMVLAGERATDEQLRRFRAEAEAAANLDHPNIVPVHEVGVHEGQPYFTMKLIEGRSLASAMPEMRGRPREAAALIAKAARAVHHAHQRGVLHRDIKPGNILLDAAGEPHVADFGLAKRGDGLASASGAVIGTPAYMAPEQARAEKGLTVAADVWSLGAVLHEMLAGRPPFRGENALEVLAAVVNDEPTRVPGDLGLIALKCLEKEPARRYASAEQLAEDLERWLRGEPIKARPVGRFERVVRWCRRNRAAAALIGVLMVATTGASLLTWWALAEKDRADFEAGEKDREALAARAAQKKAQDKEAMAVQQKRAADFQALRAEDAGHAIRMDQALRAWRRHDLAEAERLLGETPPRLRQSWETRHVRSLCRRKALTLVGHTGDVHGVAFSPDGRTVASVGRDAVRLWDARTGRESLAIHAHPDGTRHIAFSPDGTRIVCCAGSESDTAARVWDTRTGKHLLSFGNGNYDMLSYSPDGLSIAGTGSNNDVVSVWDARTGRERLRIEAQNQGAPIVAFSPDGARLVSSDGGALRVWDARTGKETLALEGDLAGLNSVAYRPDGRHIAAGFDGGFVRVWDARTGKTLLSARRHEGRPAQYAIGQDESPVRSVAYSPDGARIASVGGDGTARVWDADTGEELFSLKGHEGGATCVAFSPDGTRIATGGAGGMHPQPPGLGRATSWPRFPGAAAFGTVRVWDIGTCQETLAIDVSGGEQWPLGVMAAVFSPDGTRIASAGEDRKLRLWDAGTGRGMLTLEAHMSGVLAVAYSPDGTVVTTAGHHELKAWDAASGREKWGHLVSLIPKEFRVAYSPDGRTIASAGEYAMLRIWDARTGAGSAPLKLKVGTFIHCVAFSPDGKQIAMGTEDLGLLIWKPGPGRAPLTLVGHQRGVRCVAYSPGGGRIVSGGEDGAVLVWDAKAGKELMALRGHIGMVNAVAFGPGGGLAVSGGQDGSLRLWDIHTGQGLLAFQAHRGGIKGLAFSPDGGRVVSCGVDGMVKVWAAGATPERLVLKGARGSAHCVIYSPDGERVACSGEDGVRVWDALTGKQILALAVDSVGGSSVAFSPDGALIVADGADGTIHVWDARTGRPGQIIRCRTERLARVAFSHDGKRILCEDVEDKRFAFDVATGRPLPPDKAPVPEPGLKADHPQGTQIALVSGSDVILCHRAPVPSEAERYLGRRADTRWHATRSDDFEKAKSWPAAAFHLECLNRVDPTARPRLLAALKQADDTPLTQAIKRNLAATDAARAASSLFLPPLARPALLPGR